MDDYKQILFDVDAGVVPRRAQGDEGAARAAVPAGRGGEAVDDAALAEGDEQAARAG